MPSVNVQMILPKKFCLNLDRVTIAFVDCLLQIIGLELTIIHPLMISTLHCLIHPLDRISSNKRRAQTRPSNERRTTDTQIRINANL